MKKLVILLILLFSINTTQAKIYYYETLTGLVDATDGGTFCDVEEGTCTYDDSVDVRIEFDNQYVYADLGTETVLSYALIGDDRDSSSLSVSTNDTLFLDADDLALDTTAKTITIPGELLNKAGEVRITLTAQNSKGDIQAQDYAYVSVAQINSKNMLTRWTVEAGETVQFPFNANFDNTYDGHVDWGDDSGIETFENTRIQDLTHTYTDAGTYDIKIDGGFANEKDFSSMFFKQTIPDGMDISQWDVSSVKIMIGMFNQATLSSNFDISSWDISNVYNMQAMLAGCVTIPSGFDISSWKVSNIENITNLFSGSTFTEDLNISGWNLEDVSTDLYVFNNITVNNIVYDTKMDEVIYSKFLKMITQSYLFPESTTGQKIVAGENACAEDDEECFIAREWIESRGWTVEDATVEIELTVDENTALKSIWTVSAGETVSFPFNNIYSIVSGIIDWRDGTIEEFDDWSTLSHTYEESGKYTTLINGSYGASLNQIFYQKTIPANLDINSWNLSNAGITSLMTVFYNTTLPSNFDISSWNISNVTNLWGSFYNMTLSSSLGIDSWDVSNVTKISYLFSSSILLEGFDVSSWDVSNVRDTRAIFRNTTIPNNFSLAGWDLSNVDIYTNMFNGATISGDLVYDESVGRTVYKAFMEILADTDSAFPDSTTSQKIYVGDNRCSIGDTDCEDAETTLTNKGWVITRTTAN